MALDVIKEGSTNKLKITDTVFVYDFMTSVVTVDTISTEITVLFKTGLVKPSTTKFDDLEDNKGTADAQGYVDFLANNGFFFEPSDPNTPTSDVNIVSQSAGLALDATTQAGNSILSTLSLEVTQSNVLAALISSNGLLADLSLEATQQNVLSSILAGNSILSNLSLESTQQSVLSALQELLIDKRPNRSYEGYDNANNNNTAIDYVAYAIKPTATAKTLLSVFHACFINTNDNGRLRIRKNGTVSSPLTFDIDANGDGLDIAIGSGNTGHNGDGELLLSDYLEDRVQYSTGLYDVELQPTDVIYLCFQPLSNARFYSSVNYKLK